MEPLRTYGQKNVDLFWVSWYETYPTPQVISPYLCCPDSPAPGRLERVQVDGLHLSSLPPGCWQWQGQVNRADTGLNPSIHLEDPATVAIFFVRYFLAVTGRIISDISQCSSSQLSPNPNPSPTQPNMTSLGSSILKSFCWFVSF